MSPAGESQITPTLYRGAEPQAPDLLAERDASALTVANVLLRSRRIIVLLAVAFAVATAVVTLVLPRKYTSVALFMPEQSESSESAASALAAQFGLGKLPSGGESAEFYVSILRSRPVMLSAVSTRYDWSSGAPRTLVDVERTHADSAIAVENALKHLAKQMDASTDAKSGILTLRVTTTDARLSQQIEHRLLDLLNTFNQSIRQSQAGAERRMLQARAAEAKDSLASSENALLAFLTHNRAYASSPELTFQYERLSREVAAAQTLYTTIAQSYEKARMDEVRDTPVITVIQPPTAPTLPDARWTVLKTLIGLLAGLALGILMAFIRDFARRNRASQSSVIEEFTSLWGDTVNDLRHPWRFIRVR